MEGRPSERDSARGLRSRTGDGRHRRRRVREPGVGRIDTVVVLAIGIGINVTGIAPISGGPVAADAPLPDGQFALATTQQLRPAGAVTLYTTLVLDSTWSVEPTLLSVTPIGANKVASVRVLGTSSIEGPTDRVIGSAWDPGSGCSVPGPVS